MPGRLTPRGEAAPPVSPNIASASIPKKSVKKRTTTKKVSGPGVAYVYNLRAIECRFTLTTDREIRLQPRGQRGDLDVVNEDEQFDPIFLANNKILFEVIEPEEAHKIIAKQQVNDSLQGRPIFDQLLNEYGKSYEQKDIRIQSQTSIPVGTISPAGNTAHTEQNVAIGRVGPQITEVPGSPGHPATEFMLGDVPGEISPEDYHEFLLWKQFKAAMVAQDADADDLRASVKINPMETEPDE